MEAALSAQNETVTLLISMGASPDKTANDGHTALIFAIRSKCETTINLLVPVTQVNLGRALRFLAIDKIDVMTGELRQLVERAAQDRVVSCPTRFSWSGSKGNLVGGGDLICRGAGCSSHCCGHVKYCIPIFF